MSDPEETAPITPPPPQAPQPPPPPQPWPPGGWAPAYGVPYVGSRDHSGATTALVLGIISIACFVLTFLCCLTLPGVLCAPFAWFLGVRAKRDIERQPGVYGNAGSATAGLWMGAVMTVLGALLIAAVVAIVVWFGTTDYSMV
ncbi:hypothetical protein G5V58_00115 [Nocardioides anomalus]|uniref:DUF4190 domain-containing protein n=1 Tax=Nocardioides anomalus TaxID=2712223 RepID=A0A6G6W8A2_9ACTN|nr:hypothetical protein [Nocardioides anomalus]QIG41383.1 hypothetical protein G5V58_00115 [Nocardioides anomalus]